MLQESDIPGAELPKPPCRILFNGNFKTMAPLDKVQNCLENEKIRSIETSV